MNDVDNVVRAVGRTANYVARNLAEHVNTHAGTNPSGERQVGADVWADRLFFDALSTLDGVGGYASEERGDVVDCGEGYALAIDPLDGSSNLAPNNAVGTIVGVYDAPLPASGRSLVASIVVLYGPYATMMVARDDADAVTEYLLRDGGREPWGEFALPDDPTVVGLAGRPSERPAAFNDLADDLERDLTLRYGGATVADLAQVLEYGGLFGYPATTRHPDGKLRVHFEAAPLGYLIEAVGGASSDGTGSLLDVEPDDLHARTPTFLGNAALVERVESL